MLEESSIKHSSSFLLNITEHIIKLNLDNQAVSCSRSFSLIVIFFYKKNGDI